MELREIKGQFIMEAGAPQPIALSVNGKCTVCFYGNLGDVESDEFDAAVAIEFIGCAKSSIGVPSNETLDGHPYYKLGLESYAFYELVGSDLLAQITEMQSVHSGFNAEKWQAYKHYIITFHDEMFECIARNFTVSKGKEHYQQMAGLAQ